MTLLDEIKKPIAERFEGFKHAFEHALTSDNEILNAVFKHILNKQGKQMRPIILLLAAEIVGKSNEKSITSAVSLELLHTASLLHDDVIDETYTRRGQAAANANWGNKVAILAGDYMLSKSLKYVATMNDIRILHAFAGIGQDLSSGEILQLTNSKSLQQNEEDYFNIIKNKTAKLFAVCTQIGAMSANANDEDLAQITQFGELLGICFQLKDDLLDYATNVEIGKPTMNDIRDGKITLPLIVALQNAPDEANKQIRQTLQEKTFTDEKLSEIRQFVAQYGGISASKQRMEMYSSKAHALLCQFPQSEARHAMELLLQYTTARIQ